MSQQVKVQRELKFMPGAIVSGSWNGAFDRGGKTYYVNNITGSATASGLSWNSAVSTVSRAVTLSEASRLVHPGTTTNDYIRNTIVIQGTGTTYPAISALPSYCDVVGLGATPFGDGAGIVVVGHVSSSDGIAGSTRGSNWYNMQFVAGGAYYAVDLAIAYRTSFELCAFGGNAGSAACAIAFNVVSASGLILRDCKTIAHAAFPVIGYAMSTAGGNWNECLMERCYANASTTGYTNAGYLQNGSVVRDCIFYGGTTGLSDTSTQTANNALSFYWQNFGTGATTGITVTNGAERRCMNNYSVSNATSAVYFELG